MYPIQPLIKPKLVSRLLAILLLLTGSLPLFSQGNNLVINPSFEQNIDFQENEPGKAWARCLKNDTPDHITFTSKGDPEFYYRKYIGGLLPFDGNAYAGIFCFRTNPLRGVENIREFIQAPLRETLQKDTLYQVSLRIALDPESTTAINNFNILFGREPVFYKREKEMFELRPQIRFRQDMLDSIGWVPLKTNYKAKGGESQIILGNFSVDKSIRKKNVMHQSEMLKKWDLHDLERAAYYYIDMVRVEKLSIIAIDETPVVDEPPMIDEAIKDTISLPDYIEIEKINHDTSIVLNNIFFEFDKAELLPQSNGELDRLSTQLAMYPELAIVIEGHTDNMGTFEYNMNLSLERAQAVVNYLKNKRIPNGQISYEGHGYTRPLSENRTEQGRQLNRRVAFRLSDIKKPLNNK